MNNQTFWSIRCHFLNNSNPRILLLTHKNSKFTIIYKDPAFSNLNFQIIPDPQIITLFAALSSSQINYYYLLRSSIPSPLLGDIQKTSKGIKPTILSSQFVWDMKRR